MKTALTVVQPTDHAVMDPTVITLTTMDTATINCHGANETVQTYNKDIYNKLIVNIDTDFLFCKAEFQMTSLEVAVICCCLCFHSYLMVHVLIDF